jgi:hypothetical protein
VPSIAVNKLELNYVLNPYHPGFGQITQEKPQDFVFGPVLFFIFNTSDSLCTPSAPACKTSSDSAG